MTGLFNILVPVSVLAVLGILIAGIYTLFKGGDVSRTWSNKLMRLRVVAQFVAILVLLGAVALHRQLNP
jgi:hypothetical protein